MRRPQVGRVSLPNQRPFYTNNLYGRSSPLIFNARYGSPSPLLVRKAKKSGNAEVATSIPSILSEDCLGRRRSMSLDDLGNANSKYKDRINDIVVPGRAADVDEEVSTEAIDVDEALDLGDDIPDEVGLEEVTSCNSLLPPIEDNASSSREEWSPSPARTLDNRQAVLSSPLTEHGANPSKTRSHPKGFVNNCFAKVKNIMGNNSNGNSSSTCAGNATTKSSK